MAMKNDTKRGGRFKDLTGKKFARLLVLKFDSINNNKKPVYLVRCDCGVEKLVVGASLVNGLTQSCGCWKAERSRQARLDAGEKEVNGRNNIPEFRAWKNAKGRCKQSTRHNYHRYGGRGITMCQGFDNSFETFLRIVGFRPNSELSIDRVDNNGNYSCGECKECLKKGWSMNLRWATTWQQANNKEVCKANK